MSETLVTPQSISYETIVARRDEWKSALESTRRELERLSQETFKLQQQITALDGAVQACEALLNTNRGGSDAGEPSAQQ